MGHDDVSAAVKMLVLVEQQNAIGTHRPADTALAG